MGNTKAEVDLLRQYGEAAFFHNKTSVVSEETFRPVDGLTVEFDAIYNAQLTAWKRHELALGIERCAFVFYRADVGSSTDDSEAAIIARHARLAPGHVFINQIDASNLPFRLRPADVNKHLNRAAVGLCLSAVEGPMFASTEYLLAGLPVVTTPSRGGRDHYFDDEYCLTVPPDPRSIAEAVSVLKGRRIPRSYIRARTLERIEKDRRRFVDLINAIFAEAESWKRIAMPWPFRQPLMEWLPPEVAIVRALAGAVDAFADPRPVDGPAQAQSSLQAD
jgi:glycosyltransferase involved in cell wall biosynthesis